MIHIITIPKSKLSKKKEDKLSLYLSAEFDEVCLCVDSSGGTYEFSALEPCSKRTAENMRYFALGFISSDMEIKIT